MNCGRSRRRQAGYTLIESVIAVALLAIVAGGTVAAFLGVAKATAPDPARAAAEREMRRIVALQSALTKYADPGSVVINTAPWHTTIPSPQGSPIPLIVSATKNVLGSGYSLTITIQYPQGTGTATLSKSVALVQKAPPPDTRLVAPGMYPAPDSTPAP